MIRPERVRVGMEIPASPAGDLAVIPATVTDLTFQGPVVRLAWRLPTIPDRCPHRAR